MPIIASRASAAYGAGFSAVTTVPYAGPYGAYFALASQTLTSTASSVTFNGIPTGFKHLEIRMMVGYTGSVGAGYIHFNGDNASGNYTYHAINGDGGSTPGYSAATGQNRAGYTVSAGTSPSARNTMVMTIPDYSNSTKYKSIQSLYGWDNNGSGYIEFTSGMWLNTNPIQSITLTPANTFDSYTTISIYGVK